MSKLIHGVGISEDGEFKRYNRVGGKYVGTREYKLWVSMLDRKSTRLNSSHIQKSRMPSSA